MSTNTQSTWIDITGEQASDFLQTIRNALNKMTKTEVEAVRLFVRNRGAIAITFNKDMHPFLGFSAGYNPPSNRVMLPNDNAVINKCKWWFIVKRKTKRGGRVFITSDRVFTDPKGEPEITLFKWDWPGGDVVETCLEMLDDACLSK